MLNNMGLKNKKILVTGGAGFLGSFVVNELLKKGVLKKNIFIPRSKDYDLRKLEDCKKVIEGMDIVIHLAAKVGGIGFNREHPGQLYYDNLIMGAQLMEEARKQKIEKFVAIGTICAYPKFTPTPFKEKDLWIGYPEETNAPYGLAKKMMLVQSQAYRQEYDFHSIYLLPVNLYGPNDNFDPNSSHVIPALIKKVIEAKEKNSPFIEAWGTGKATREFLYVEDAAKAIVLATEKYDKGEPVNIGSGMEISIKKLIRTICSIAGYKGKIKWDKTKPDGQPRRQLDVTRAKKEFGFKANTNFKEGLRKTIEWYIKK
jgi:GDP-L-fucose synthase